MYEVVFLYFHLLFLLRSVNQSSPHTQMFPRNFARVLSINNQALAEQGFMLMMVYGLGSSGRSKEFHDVTYGNLGLGLTDHGFQPERQTFTGSWPYRQNVNPSATFKLAENLVKADKQFDLLIFPSQRHGYTGKFADYFTKKRWNYFVENLLGKKPLWEFSLEEKTLK